MHTHVRAGLMKSQNTAELALRLALIRLISLHSPVMQSPILTTTETEVYKGMLKCKKKKRKKTYTKGGRNLLE